MAPWEEPQTVLEAERFLREESSEGRTYPQMVLVGTESGPGRSVEQWQLPIPLAEFERRLDDYMTRNGWRDTGEDRYWRARREDLGMAVMRLLRPRE
jgi:hypothetical protein